MNDIDFDQFIKLLDGALASDDKNVKQALRKFLFVAAMVMGNDTEPGPFTQMMDTIDSLQLRLAQLEAQMNTTTSIPSIQTSPYWTGTGTAANPPFTSPSTAGGATGTVTGGTATSNGFTTFTNTTGYTGTITLPNASSTTTGTTYTITNNPGNTIGTTWYDMDDPKTGTSIKEEIKEGLEKLAKSA